MTASGNYDEIKLVQDAVNFQNQFFVADENIISTQILLQLVARYKIIGKSIYDCAIVACIKQQNIKNLLTNNPSDFTRYNEGFSVVKLIDG